MEKKPVMLAAIVVMSIVAVVVAPPAQAQTPGPSEGSEGTHEVVFTLDPDNHKKIIVTPVGTDKVQTGDQVLFHNKSGVKITVDFSSGELGTPFTDADFSVSPSAHSESAKTLTVTVEAPEGTYDEYFFTVTGAEGEAPAPDQSPVIRVGPPPRTD